MPKLPHVRKATLTKPFPPETTGLLSCTVSPSSRMFRNENHLGMSLKAKAAMEKAITALDGTEPNLWPPDIPTATEKFRIKSPHPFG